MAIGGACGLRRLIKIGHASCGARRFTSPDGLCTTAWQVRGSTSLSSARMSNATMRRRSTSCNGLHADLYNADFRTLMSEIRGD